MSNPKSNYAKVSEWSAVVAILLSIIAAVLGFYTNKEAEMGLKFENIKLSEVSNMSIGTLENDIIAIRSRVEALSDIPQDVAVAAKLVEIETQIASLTQQVTVINNAIMDSPGKALEIPILKRDISSLEKQYVSTTQALEREITRAYDTIKWVIGTIILSILGLGASVFLKAKDDE